MQWSAERAGGCFTQIDHAGHAPFFGHADAVVAALNPLLESYSE
jgi:pimeloyl-[acyl-carrier protein] methyl ester esterase